ncbi:27169_t:CDS:2 [Dentiscutata erythropus]|uniref:27169_t:CDS:1 n=1 Tax=Dentiscutata erythropus TaxID=1348616 RepID=A0A9N8VHV5_9GLOM|nr:27169_t:CDS:2 [Dentiscutata erythropus]
MSQQPQRNAPKVHRIFIPSLHDGTRLEARVGVNRTDDQNLVKAVVISHPYGPLGGNFYNNVVVAVEQYFQDKGYLTIAFNFRGSGKSKGRTSWSGEPECDDYKTMLEFLSKSGKIGENTILQIPKISDVNVPKTRNTYCKGKNCRKHTPHKVSQYKKGKDSLYAQGKRRYDRKQSGYGGQTKPVFHKKAKTTKKIVLRLECQSCKYKHQVAIKRCKHFELGGDKKTKGAALVF